MDEYNGERYIKIPISTWGSKKLVTLQLLKNQVNNEDYLYNEVTDLWDATPPTTRKYFKPVAIDQNKSYGVVLTEKTNEYNMYALERTDVLLNFYDQPAKAPDKEQGSFNSIYLNNVIDTVKTTCVYENNAITLPKEEVTYLDKNTRDYSPFTAYDSAGNALNNDMTCNEFWYIGYAKDRVYETRPNWLMNEEHGGIPAICRAQTFKVDLKDKTQTKGTLESVVLNLRGEYIQNGVPLIVEITEAVEQNGIYYPASRDHINNWRYNSQDYGDGRSAKQIAKKYCYFTNTNPGVMSITFDWGAKVEDGKYYAIVLRSPLNHQPSPYAVGGWNKHCDPDVYPDGNAFMSGNNGYTWKRYGKDEKISYHQGMYAPQDFAFQCHIRQHYSQYKKGSFEVYTKPLHFEKINKLQLYTRDESLEGNIHYYAYNNITGKWVEFNEYGQISFNVEEQRPDVTIIKAVLTLTNGTKAPYIEYMAIAVNHGLFSKGMLRTQPYTPRTTGILAANTYSHVHCPYTVQDSQNDKVIVDVVKETTNYTHIDIVHLVDILKYRTYCPSITDDAKTEIEEIVATEDQSKKATLIATFISVHSDIIEALKEINAYVLEDPNLGSFYIRGDSAYPILRCSLQPDNSETIDFTEWLDYTVNYDDDTSNIGNTLTFNTVAIRKLVQGTLSIEYNPVFAKDIPQTDYESYSVKDIDLGFIEQEYTVSADDLKIETLGLILKTEALNPLREVYVTRIVELTTQQITLVEGQDFTVDYENKTIYISSTNLLSDDKITIKYTPYIVNESISLCYHIERANNDAISIQGNYIDYKT